MRLDYDAKANRARLHLVERGAPKRVARKENALLEGRVADTFLHFDDDDRLLLVEFTKARSVLRGETLNGEAAPTIEYDSAVDAVSLDLVADVGSRVAVRTALALVHLDQAFIAFDFDKQGMVLDIEIIGASRVLTEETLESSVPRS